MAEATASPEYNFPDLDLALHCIDLYFLHSNLYLPLLHRPTFDKSVKEGLYLTNDNFAPVFLLVCAVGARHSDNPQVRLDGIDSHHSAGWKWFKQVEIMKQSLRLAPPTLYDLQLYCVSPVLCRLSALLTNIGIAVYTIPPRLLCPTVLLDPGGDWHSFSSGCRCP